MISPFLKIASLAVIATLVQTAQAVEIGTVGSVKFCRYDEDSQNHPEYDLIGRRWNVEMGLKCDFADNNGYMTALVRGSPRYQIESDCRELIAYIRSRIDQGECVTVYMDERYRTVESVR